MLVERLYDDVQYDDDGWEGRRKSVNRLRKTADFVPLNNMW